MIQPTTFIFKAEKGRMLPWECMTHYGQRAKVILSDTKGFKQVQRSAYAFGRKHGNRRLQLILRCQTFVIYELMAGLTEEQIRQRSKEVLEARKERAKARYLAKVKAKSS
jgi:hypothetical protein